MTWNCRGRQMTAAAERNVIATQRGPKMSGPWIIAAGDVGEDGAEPAGDAPDREDADGEERDELDDRLDGDGGDDAVVALVGVEVAGAEEDGEEREAGSDPGRRRRPRPSWPAITS